MAPCAGQPVANEVPWAQKVLSPERVWPHATGAGVTVAVIDSGVDTRHPQMRGQISAQHNLLAPAPNNCVPHGTEVASIINAQPAPGVGFHGLAPGARVLPIRVSDRGPDGTGSSDVGDFAEAIRWASTRAQVINISMVMHASDERVRSAIEDAIAHDVVVVAAAGNDHQATGADPPSYPAAYPGVLGVGAIGVDGSRLPQSQVGPYVDVVAPGAEVLVAEPVGGHRSVSGTSYAAAFVSATVALVRDARPGLKAGEVVNRIIATATPSHGGDGYGEGVVNPYRAVTEDALFADAKAAVPSAPNALVDPDVAAERARWQRLSSTSVLVAVVLVALLFAVTVGRSVYRRGQARRWLPSRAPRPRDQAEPAGR
jgi:type VII secretion-associated serine protease mycosin